MALKDYPPERKLIKVVLEFEDEIQTLKGKEANEWLKEVNGHVLMGWVHGQLMSKFNWKRKKK